ncbi:MAG: phosphoribosylformylglycinamidine synthase I [Desulfobacterales bacterium]|nr:phosphoribosylformylglycinamidine synthase I [Desulfobacterales bacterium]MDD4073763.1 phosphoribosylformylglycinamidine synthase I [Desulfobacterales bacterium]MDD4391669.1 phosphoribosylformylglycinamidine synthase I [Desulfobacterales bacterium]
MKRVRVLVLTGYGLNCDHETAYAFKLCGAEPERVHINSLIDGTVELDAFQIMAFVGGFSWGDDHGAGVIQAVRLKTNIGEKLIRFIEKGNLIIGICNGFQTLVNLGLLPGFDHDYATRSVALTFNDCGNFRDDWVHLNVNEKSSCVFTRGLDRIELPVRHGEGKFYSDEPTVKRLIDNHQVVLQYALADGMPAGGQFPYNPNGAVYDIAGICDPTGRVFGLMPHPEAYNHFTNHPNWTLKKELMKRAGGGASAAENIPPGIQIFKNAVDFMIQR